MRNITNAIDTLTEAGPELRAAHELLKRKNLIKTSIS